MRSLLGALVLLGSVQEPAPRPAVEFLVPGFRAVELPVRLPNINCLEYAPDGRLYAAGYDGRVHVLSDADGDGLEETAGLYWDRKGDLLTPVGLAAAPDAIYVAARGKVALLPDADRDGKADECRTVTDGWVQEKHNNNTRNDASGVALDAEGNLYFSLGCSDYRNAYLLDKEGKPRYDLRNERGTILKVSPDRKRREILSTGIRFAVGLAINRRGDLFATDQEGDTWFPGGNPFDELLHIVPGRHYGFPFRHPQYLPDVVDEPAIVDFGPQHQSTCGFRFNEARNGHGRFGPPAWEGDALVTGFSRGKLWRVPLVRTRTGYVGRPVLLASFDGLAVDVALSPKGDLVVACHGGRPDWGSGPQGPGRLWKLVWDRKETPRPVIAWAPGPLEVRVAFDRPASPDPGPALLEAGEFVRAADRWERIRPGYKVVAEQQAAVRHPLKVNRISRSKDDRTLALWTGAHPWRATYALSLPGAGTEIDYELTGVDAAFVPDDGPSWEGWLPHPTTAVALAWTRGSAEHEALAAAASRPGRLTLSGRFTPPAPGTTVLLDANVPFRATLGGAEAASTADAGGRHRAQVTVPKGDAAFPFRVELRTASAMPDLDLSYRKEGDPHLRPLKADRFSPSWVPDAKPPRAPAASARPRTAPGNIARGREVFFGKEARCAVCHSIRGEGGKVAPDLTPSSERDPDAVLRDIVDPNGAINPDFVTYLIELSDGSILTGVLLAQDAERIVLVDAEGKEHALARPRIRQFRSSALSLMPEGFKNLGEDALRDLVAFLCAPDPGRK